MAAAPSAPKPKATSCSLPLSPLRKVHILITGASSGLGRGFFEHYSSFPPTTHYVRGIDARPYPTHPGTSSCTVGASGHFYQLDLSAEALVQKYVRSATLAPSSKPHASRAASPIISYRPPQRSLTSERLPPTSSSTPSHVTWPAPNSGTATPRSAATADDSSPPHYTGPFDLVIHSAGIRGLVPAHESQHPADIAGAESIAVMDGATMRRAFEINCVATFALIKALLPSLRASAALRRNDSHHPPPKVVVMASRMGSQASNSGGGAYAYRASKAALNAVVRSFSIDVPEVAFALVHPGRVETGLVRTREEGAVEVGESVGDILELIRRFGEEEGEGGLRSGCFVDRWGNEIPW
ncbi:hypothetical protein B0J12DRAFT_686881 [Macrophomina phaseolina]|uniref:Short-chain dehydrogenase/reductase SDR n=1 Tax=Macrophomina phaseolina TaxID=35725 RepID=A0ABQ8FSQ3_9PEZI|nr:hypothetical protein B0J12DRAFT_686881 [Macrophomina phaseolina]